jgi:hypothetical protein
MFDDLIAENPDALTMDGFDDAYLGTIRRCGQPTLACYSYNKCIAVLVSGGMSHEEALEYFEFNCVGAWVGPNTPCIPTESGEL